MIGARAGIRIRVKRSAISQDIQATPRGQIMRTVLNKRRRLDLDVREVTGDVPCDAVPHSDGGDIGELAYELLVTLEIGAENTGVLVDEFY